MLQQHLLIDRENAPPQKRSDIAKAVKQSVHHAVFGIFIYAVSPWIMLESLQDVRLQDLLSFPRNGYSGLGFKT